MIVLKYCSLFAKFPWETEEQEKTVRKEGKSSVSHKLFRVDWLARFEFVKIIAKQYWLEDCCIPTAFLKYQRIFIYVHVRVILAV